MDFIAGSRNPRGRAKPNHSELAEDPLVAKAFGAARLHPKAARQEMPYTCRDVTVDFAIRRRAGAVGKIGRPASQNLIEAGAHFLPASDVTRYQEVSHFLLDALPTLLRRTSSEIPMTIRLVAMWPERVTQKTKAFFARCPDASLRFIQSEAKSHHHAARPIQCLCRMPAAENHEIICVGDHLSAKSLALSGDPPVLEKAVHIEVREHGANDSALWSSTSAASSSRHASLTFVAPFLDRELQPHLDQM